MDYKYSTADFIHSQTEIAIANLFCGHPCSFVPRKVSTIRLGFRFWNPPLLKSIAPAWIKAKRKRILNTSTTYNMEQMQYKQMQLKGFNSDIYFLLNF